MPALTRVSASLHFPHVEACLAQALSEGRVRCSRPDRQHPLRPEGGIGCFPSFIAVQPIIPRTCEALGAVVHVDKNPLIDRRNSSDPPPDISAPQAVAPILHETPHYNPQP